jgi:hypothetical protein
MRPRTDRQKLVMSRPGMGGIEDKKNVLRAWVVRGLLMRLPPFILYGAVCLNKKKVPKYSNEGRWTGCKTGSNIGQKLQFTALHIK